MTTSAALRAAPVGPGGTTNTDEMSAEGLIRATRQVLDAFGIDMSQSKVSRLVRRYRSTVAPKGFPFADYVVNGLVITAAKRAVVADELRRAISYADPTGETAVRNVARERGY